MVDDIKRRMALGIDFRFNQQQFKNEEDEYNLDFAIQSQPYPNRE